MKNLKYIMIMVLILLAKVLPAEDIDHKQGENMHLGAFSISLSVKDIKASAAFYEKLGFRTMGGDIDQNWVILKNDDTVIGLFQGLFEGNLLTFNPGWNQNAEEVEPFSDIRDIKKQLEELDLGPIKLDNDNSSGPASFTISDPDGNIILIDQHR